MDTHLGLVLVDRHVVDAVGRWRRADERLYPVVMVDPERYVRIVSVIRATADRLGSYETVEGLVEARRRGQDLVALSCATAGVPIDALGDVETVADAAFGLRHREVVTAQTRQRAATAIASARERGDHWVTVDEAGSQHQPGVVGYQRIDMRISDGAAIRSAVDVDPASFHPVYSIEHLWLDPDTGAVVERSAAADTFTAHEPWETAVAQWRSVTAGGGGGP